MGLPGVKLQLGLLLASPELADKHLSSASELVEGVYSMTTGKARGSYALETSLNIFEF